MDILGFPVGSVVKNPPVNQYKRRGFTPWVRKIPLAKEMATHFQVFLPGKSHG